MRLIDADKLKESISSNAGMLGYDGEFWIRLRAALSGIDFAEAVDAVPVVHSRWEIVEDDYGNQLMLCPSCKSEFYDGDNDTVDQLHNYCPNCGAKMDGDTDEKSD